MTPLLTLHVDRKARRDEIEPLIAAAIISASLAFIGTVAVAFYNQRQARRQKREDNFFQALDWLTGGSQTRNVGIAAVEFFGGEQKGPKNQTRRFRSLSIDALSNSAMYLLLQSSQGIAVHERNNLRRIMDFLLGVTQEEARKHASQYEDLKIALKVAQQRRNEDLERAREEAQKRRVSEREQQDNTAPELPPTQRESEGDKEEDFIWMALHKRKWDEEGWEKEGIWVEPSRLANWQHALLERHLTNPTGRSKDTVDPA